MIATCQNCQRRIRRARTRANRTIALDAEPHPRGSIDIQADGVAVVLGGAAQEGARIHGLELYRLHSCAQR